MPPTTAIEAAARVTAVTVYPGRAAVTRSAQMDVLVGVNDVRFRALPMALDPNSLQARAIGSDAKVIGVDFIERPVTSPADPAVAALDAELESTRRAIARLEEDLALVAEQERLVSSIGARVSGDASERVGTPQLDLKALQGQIEFIGGQRMGLLAIRRELNAKLESSRVTLKELEARRAARAGKGGVEREAVVSLAATAAGRATVELTYLVVNAGWTPTYNVRGSLDTAGGGSATIEYDALIVQRSGEDWSDVAMTLSTAEPTTAANPPTIQPWFVDVVLPPPPPPAPGAVHLQAPGADAAPGGRAGERMAAGLLDASGGEGGDLLSKAVERMRASAEVLSGGPAVSFLLPRSITVPTDSDRVQRARIATFDAKPDFVHVAVPLLTSSVYLRGTLVNGSPYLLLPGPASIFLGNDYIGPTALPTVAPSARVDVYFGVDRSLSARRVLVSRTTERTGLFSGGVRITSDHRIEIDNPSARPTKLELLDRIPVSRNEQITVELTGPSVPLSTDAEYLRDGRPQGILRWDLTVPAGATGAKALPVTWGVRVSHGKDVRATPLPE